MPARTALLAGARAPDLFPVESPSCPNRFTVHHREVGMLRIYLKPSDKIGPRRSGGQSRSIASDSHREGGRHHQRRRAKYPLRLQQSRNDPGERLGIADPHLTICVELVGDRDQLDLFCRRHGDLIGNKVIVYKRLEHLAITRKTELTRA